jgi:hypothetical protein
MAANVPFTLRLNEHPLIGSGAAMLMIDFGREAEVQTLADPPIGG